MYSGTIFSLVPALVALTRLAAAPFHKLHQGRTLPLAAVLALHVHEHRTRQARLTAQLIALTTVAPVVLVHRATLTVDQWCGVKLAEGGAVSCTLGTELQNKTKSLS